MALKHGLGRGLDALLNDGSSRAKAAPAPAPDDQATIVLRVPLAEVHVAPWQPRQGFGEEAMEDLIRSVKERGVLQPLLVRKQGTGYQLMAGERRLRAAGAAGLKDVPVLVLDATDEEAVAVALIENLQRQDLNAIEEAEGYHVLAEKYALTQEEIATRVGKARASVANAMRLLTLHPQVKAMVSAGRLSAGHAKVLTGLEIPAEQLHFAERVLKEGLSVRHLEKAIEHGRAAPRKPRASRNDMPADHTTFLGEKLQHHLGTAVRVNPSRTYANGKKAKGTIEIDFYSNEDLDRIVELLGVLQNEM
ncbi:MAG: ParB/RepB/Spo0J family partition protein [Lentisphaerae bacterium]|nr:ParB/RepB/Spo0J family partition protein [Lentisphaerota bacterium]